MARATITLTDALGSMSRPLAAVVANWVKAPAWRRRVLRQILPGLAQALDDLAAAVEAKIGPL